MASHTKVAAGNIKPMRFVKLTTGDGKCLVCGAGDKVYGVSQKGTRRVPYSSLDDGYCAIAGEELQVYGPGEDPKPALVLGGTVAAGDRLKSDSDGAGVTTVTNLDEYGAIAMWAGVAGEIIEVEVRTGQISA